MVVVVYKYMLYMQEENYTLEKNAQVGTPELHGGGYSSIMEQVIQEINVQKTTVFFKPG
jgi:hypothetical protein